MSTATSTSDRRVDTRLPSEHSVDKNDLTRPKHPSEPSGQPLSCAVLLSQTPASPSADDQSSSDVPLVTPPQQHEAVQGRPLEYNSPEEMDLLYAELLRICGKEVKDVENGAFDALEQKKFFVDCNMDILRSVGFERVPTAEERRRALDELADRGSRHSIGWVPDWEYDSYDSDSSAEEVEGKSAEMVVGSGSLEDASSRK
ncbi:hypothetical protein BJ508DRAFT_326108 [Ascobolus immersus RN42]|uniref:Uncharacterized protein n=1 Tax=Ascobolus immersus RN42 TaxID=1160509 RepID=A0A3N4I8T4_ASCIM|nr:hypothetical protein BJ508DRAFT_326108 [Ascobolus immersus RN42]